MNIKAQALFDDTAITGARAFGGPDVTSSAMKTAIREWFNLFFMRVPEREEDPAQRIPCAIIGRLVKACFAEYDSSFNSVPAPGSKADWMNVARKAIDAVKLDALQWAFTLLERRSVDRRGYLTIQNKLYLSNTPTTLEYEIPLDSLPQYAALAPEHTYSVPFGGLGMAYVRMPMANTVDGSPDGVSIYESAVQLIHNIYKNEYQLGREFELGRSRIIVGADKLITPDPEGGVMRLKDDVFVGLDGETSGAGIDIFSPVLRDESFERRKQSYLKACENVIGLKRGLLSDVEATERTAKEITSSEGDYSLSIIDLQRMWYNALSETLRISDLWGQTLGFCSSQAVDIEHLLSVNWGNGILYDDAKSWQETLEMVQSGILKPELALAKKFDLPCETPEDLEKIRAKYMPEAVPI